MAADWTGDFLASLSLSPNVAEACRAAHISRKTAYERRKADPEFARRWQEAQDESTDALVGEMYRRAVHGVGKPVYYKGHLVDTIREYSDTLAIFLAKTHRPEVYGDRLKVSADVVTHDSDGLRSELAGILAALRGRSGLSEDQEAPGTELPRGPGGGGDRGPAEQPPPLEAPR